MVINKLTDTVKSLDVENKINEIIDNLSSRHIGEIVTSTMPLTDAGLHLLDGSLISGSGSYSAFVDYIADLYDSGDYTAIFETEANWQTAVTTYGVCGKFVYDSVNNTVRLPKYNSKIYTGGGTAPVIGNGMTLGFTDGTNNCGIVGQYSTVGTIMSGAGYGKDINTTVTNTPNPTSGKTVGITSDSTKSGLIADLSNITTSLDGYYYIVVATSTKTDIQVDIDEIATDLNGKVDIADLQEVQCIVETYVNGTSWYRIWSDGWCEQGGEVYQNANASIVVDLLKEYRDTNYTVHRNSGYGTGGYNGNTYAIHDNNIWNLTTSSFTAQTYNAEGLNRFRWTACGYIEV